MQQKEFLVIANIHRRKVLRVLDKTMHGLLSVKIYSKDLYVLNNYNFLYTLNGSTQIYILPYYKNCHSFFLVQLQMLPNCYFLLHPK